MEAKRARINWKMFNYFLFVLILLAKPKNLLSIKDRCINAVSKYQNKEFLKQMKKQLFGLYSSLDMFSTLGTGLRLLSLIYLLIYHFNSIFLKNFFNSLHSLFFFQLYKSRELVLNLLKNSFD